MTRTVKYLSLALLVLCLAATLVACSRSNDNVSVKDGVSYTLNKEGTAYTVTDCAQSETVVNIPATYNGLPVIGINQDAFLLCRQLTDVTLPDSLTYIGQGAFMWCDKLTEITIPSGVTSIDKKAFYMSGLTEITLPDSVTKIGEAAFASCTALTSADLGAGVTSMGPSVLADCSALESVTVSFLGSTKGTPERAHLGYLFGAHSPATNASHVPSTLRTVTVLTGESIEAGAFQGCAGLTQITLPDELMTVGLAAFDGCTNLAYTSHADALYLGSSKHPHLVLVRATNPDMTAFFVPSETAVILSGAFRGYAKLSMVTLGDNLSTIQDEAFANCFALASVTIPQQVESIGAFAFKNCTSLKTVTINSKSLSSMHRSSFDGCVSLTYNEHGNALYLGNTANPYLALVRAADTTVTACHVHAQATLVCANALDGYPSLTSITFERTRGWMAGDQKIAEEELAIPTTVPSLLTSVYPNTPLYYNYVSSMATTTTTTTTTP